MKRIIKQQGFSVMSALFVVVILALIGSYIVSLSTLTSASNNLIIQGQKAYLAANSGLEWGIYTVAPANGSGPYNCPTSPTTLTFTQNGLKNFQAVVTCAATSVTEGSVTYNFFQITSVGSYTSNNRDYAMRTLYATITQPGV